MSTRVCCIFSVVCVCILFSIGCGGGSASPSASAASPGTPASPSGSPPGPGSPATTSTTLTADVNPANTGAKVTFTAFVTPATATGKVTFNDGKNQIGSIALNSGAASFSTTSLSAGSHSITAAYSGDAKNASSSSAAVIEVIKGASDIRAVNHVVIMLQENRSFDHYFGGLNDYRLNHGLPANVDVATTANFNPGYNGAPRVFFYKLNTVCTEAPSPSWNEAHVDYNRDDLAHGPGLNDGFVQTAAGDARDDNKAGVKPQFHDIDGIR